MTDRLTPDLIADGLDYRGEIAIPDDHTLAFDKPTSAGEVRVTLWRFDADGADDVEVEARTFRIVEVES